MRRRFVVPMGGGAPVPWTPADIVTRLWYDASDLGTITSSAGDVTQWDDKSGNSDHLTAISGREPKTGTQTINSLNTIEFIKGSTSRLTADFSVINYPFVVVCVRFWAFSENDYMYQSFNDVAGYTFGESTISGDWRAIVGGIPAPAGFFDTDVLASAGATGGAGTPTIQQINGGLSTNNAWVTNGLAGLNIGAIRGNPNPILATWYWSGKVGEFIVIPSFDTGDRQKVEGYLAWKWGLESKLPDLHPYKLAPPMI